MIINHFFLFRKLIRSSIFVFFLSGWRKKLSKGEVENGK